MEEAWPPLGKRLVLHIAGILVADGAQTEYLIDIFGEIEARGPAKLMGLDVHGVEGELDALISDGTDILQHGRKA